MPCPALEVADILRDHGAAWREANRGHVSLGQLKVMSAIERCRTAALGGHVARCEDDSCGHTVIAYNSCRNRHCPKCQGAAARKWLAAREAELLPVGYFHVVYTLPAGLRDVAYVEALIAMVYASGRAVVFSTLTLAVGFFVGVFSSFVPTVHFGLLTGAACLLGLISQFVLLPLSLILFQPLGRLRPAAALGSLLAVVVLVTGATAGPALAQETQGGLLLKDQFGNVDGPPRHRGQPVLLIYGKVEGMRRMKAWEERLRDKVPGALVVLRGLDAREAQGKKTETEVNERLQLNVPRDIAILVDWKGDLIRAYGLPDANVSTTILDAQGKSCHTASGPVTPEALEQVRRVLVRARETGTCP